MKHIYQSASRADRTTSHEASAASSEESSYLLTVVGSAVSRYGVALILFAIGLLKFTPAEAEAIRPLMTSSPLLRWMYDVWSVASASRVIGVIEMLAALGMALRVVSARAAAVGSALALATFLVTLSFFLTAPGMWDPKVGFPILGGGGQFLIKDVVLLGASIWSLGEAQMASRARDAR
jgi:reactive chlorine resistance protein C